MNDAPSPPPIDPASHVDRGKGFQFWRCFWLTFLVVSLGFAWYCYYVPSNNIVWADDFASAQQEAAQTGKPMILFFTGTWCVPCRIMKRTVFADAEVADAINDEFISVAIYVDGPNAAAAFRRYPVGATPTTIVTDSQGNVLQQTAGGMNKADFLDFLDNSLTGS